MRARLVAATWLSLCAVGGTVSEVRADILTVTNSNTRIEVDPESVFGLFTWDVDGVNNIFEQWFWLRTGDAPFETSLDTLTNTRQQAAGHQISLGYTGFGLDIDVLYSVFGGAAGSHLSTISERITFTNTTPMPIALAWFMETDLDVGGTGGGDVAVGGIDRIVQTDGEVAVVAGSPMPAAFEIAAFPDIFVSLTDMSITNLTNTGSPFGPGDATFAFQWNLTVPAGQSLSIVVDNSKVTEPGTLMLLGPALLGLGAAVRWRRRLIAQRLNSQPRIHP